MTEPLRVVSFGAGVQSTTLLHLVLRGTLPTPDVFIFADTGCEPPEVYTHLAHCEKLLKGAAIPLIRVKAGNLMADVLKGVAPDGASRDSKAGHYTNIPTFLDEGDGDAKLGSRHCTKDYKIIPIRRKIRELLGKTRPEPGDVEQWFGISVDEAVKRMRDSDVQYIKNRYPLVYDVDWTRAKCKMWLAEIGVGVPERSACIICPFRTDLEWRRLKQDPKVWRRIIGFDAAIRNYSLPAGKQYLHKSLKPINEVDFSTEEERGQESLFSHDCGGLCGT